MSNFVQKERAETTVNIDKLNAFLDPDHERTQNIFKEIINDPILTTPRNYYDLTKPQLRELSAKKIARLSRYVETEDFEEFEERSTLLAIADPAVITRIGINLNLFCNAIKGNGTDEQIKYWLFERGTMQLRDIYGCFAMTEMAHGSNVAALETTATYNPERQTFKINTPELRATKWWIGGAAHSANYAVVYARLISKGKDYGVKIFVVQLRDPNHELVQGVTIGDIGTKMGRDAIDNGWIQFHNVEVPREFMLQRYTKIDPDGTVHLTPLEQISYSALIQGRVAMTMDSFRQGARFITIALRYAVGRQQFGKPGQENQIINYALHQHRLLPYLSLVYLLGPGSQKLVIDYRQILKDLHDGKNLKKSIADLKDLFVNSASLKATNTWLISQLIDEARQACGGHGYHAYSGLGRAFNDWSVQQTWEGDNNVLSINAGRSIIKYYEAGQKGKKLGEDFEYLKQKFDSNLKFDDDRSLVDIWSLVIIKVAQHALSIYNGDWESVSQERLLLSKFHSNRYLTETFYKRLTKSSDLGSKEKETLKTLFKLYTYYFIDKFAGTFLQFDILDASRLTHIQAETKKLFNELRPNLIGLTDAFKYPDEIINSSLGNFNGDFYNNYFQDVVQNYGKGDKAPYIDVLTDVLKRPSLDELSSFSKTKKTLEKLGDDI
ncbi:Acyl-coenzyme A oxidase 4 [Wickerhamomyces ciferrii]|uniref:Acyl-coenzyme A oxidase n=1 Tax=Wickerhamomyces ciferrii (strain ATCC 14091 / BCRC 22168 / CBS 111 / JCM 3599 / NBRC 0793 / NRRL Y-1031 F-60-10) TaxID=1206466 RepID=K0KJJ8_WICCF|nr:Acyl-coenzyme A oxidase 4 [Wickerhamomyces ciferrii]CCH41258.1 Acyl-coenzyme A oxidase 4 [Wickerhamomyces ciferrii]